jgi:hypothetical protein
MITMLVSRFAIACDTGKTFLGIPAWYKYLNFQDDGYGGCKIIIDKNSVNDYWLIGFGVVDILLRIAGMVAVAFIIYGGFQYMISQGESDKTSSAKTTILNAIIGLVIVLLASGIVAFVADRFGA